jgi:hypothetical protein
VLLITLCLDGVDLRLAGLTANVGYSGHYLSAGTIQYPGMAPTDTSAIKACSRDLPARRRLATMPSSTACNHSKTSWRSFEDTPHIYDLKNASQVPIGLGYLLLIGQRSLVGTAQLKSEEPLIIAEPETRMTEIIAACGNIADH